MMDELVTVRTYDSLPEAEIARAHLESMGIPSVLADAETIGMDWLLSNAIGNVKLQVARSKVDSASAALKAVTAEQRQTRKKNRKQRKGADKRRKGTGDAECLACGASLREGQAACSECGWSYLGGEGEEQEGKEEDRNEKGPSGRSAMEVLHSWKRPVFLLFLTPALLAILAVAFLLLSVIGLLISR